MKDTYQWAIVLRPFVLLLVMWLVVFPLAKLILWCIPDGKVKRLLTRRIG